MLRNLIGLALLTIITFTNCSEPGDQISPSVKEEIKDLYNTCSRSSCDYYLNF